MRFRYLLPVFSVLIAQAGVAGGSTNASVNFDRQIRPILSDNCFTCHGPDEKHRMAGLHFDTKEGAFGKTGVIVAGDSGHSRMYARVSNPNEAMRMPPTYSGRKLSTSQVELIKRWIDEGAKWDTHWAFVTPHRPEVPPVQEQTSLHTPIDAFIEAKLETEHLKMSPAADKATLLRRVTFDLTGLPPTLEERSAFLADNAPDAYSKVVDRLLASPRYGERMAMQWLDFARYADTHGYHIDSAREMWPWRDWVIDAFNRNMPYNQFTVEQIAGDLLPQATQAQRIATGFNRNHMINFEGGAIPEEYQNEYIVDRIEATSTTWLGLTLGCARCHDHKYDPLRQKDFYSFGAFFNSVPEEGLDGYKGNAVPFLQLPSTRQSAIKKELQNYIQQKESDLDKTQREWEEHQRQVPVMDVTAGMTAEWPLHETLGEHSRPELTAKLVSGKLSYVPGRLSKAADFTEEPQVSFGDAGGIEARQPFTASLWLKPEGPSGMAVLQRYDGSALGTPGWEVALDYCVKSRCNVIVRLRSKVAGQEIEVRSGEGLTLSEWAQLTVAYDGSARAKGVQIFVNGHSVPLSTVADKLPPETSFRNGELQIGRKDWGTPFKGQAADLRLYSRRLYPEEALQLGLLNPARQVLEIPADHRTDDQKKWLRGYFLAAGGNGLEKQMGVDQATLKRGLAQLDREIPSTMVMGEMEKPRETYVLLRGDYRTRGEKVEPNTPAVLPPLPKDAPLNRLTLARWLVDPANPLTARVAVNHFWQMYFGIGLVKTSEDFGSQGDPPSHPELLDWLATEFIRTNWDVKAMQRLIVTSAVYQQQSAVTPELLASDPENRLLARGPRFRLPAEMVRDNALAVSGLLNPEVGGRSVLPYQPKGLWEEMAFGGDFSAQTYEQGHGADLYRRSMYTFWKRTVPYPSLNTFDAPDREKCTARRGTTNTPLQALVLMNDPTFLEAARVLAERDLKQAGPNASERIRYAFRLATNRDPSERETNILQALYERQKAHYDRNEAAAAKLLAIGESKPASAGNSAELAAWTMVASTILNLDETVTKN